MQSEQRGVSDSELLCKKTVEFVEIFREKRILNDMKCTLTKCPLQDIRIVTSNFSNKPVTVYWFVRY